MKEVYIYIIPSQLTEGLFQAMSYIFPCVIVRLGGYYNICGTSGNALPYILVIIVKLGGIYEINPGVKGMPYNTGSLPDRQVSLQRPHRQ